MQPPKPDPRRALPGVDRLTAAVCGADPGIPRWAATAAARDVLDVVRGRVTEAGPPASFEALTAEARVRARELSQPRPRRVVNATGVVLHTNLGRAVLAPGAAQAAVEAATHYSDLELDVASGRRGNRLEAVSDKLVRLSGAPAGMAVNNNAAALLLAVNTLAAGREVIVSRGELVEIGGSFRLPAMLAAAGVRLVEVGTTNRTHARDYRDAIGPDTGLLLKVHRSNFEQRGFVAEVELGSLAAIAREAEVPLVEDLGSGTLVDLRSSGLPEESFAPARLKLGADVVCFSGDKLLGGPQAGLLLGDRETVAALRSNPLARALRLDKMTLAALDWTLAALLAGESDRLPALRQLLESADSVEARARRLADRLGAAVAADAASLRVEATRAPVGGGSVPGFELPSWAVRIEPAGSARGLAARLRQAPVPVIARVVDDAVLLDARTLLGDDEDALAVALEGALELGPTR